MMKIWTIVGYMTRKLLRERLERDGYLFIRGALDRETVLRARSYVIHDMGRVFSTRLQPHENLSQNRGLRLDIMRDFTDFTNKSFRPNGEISWILSEASRRVFFGRGAVWAASLTLRAATRLQRGQLNVEGAIEFTQPRLQLLSHFGKTYESYDLQISIQQRGREKCLGRRGTERILRGAHLWREGDDVRLQVVAGDAA